MSQPTYSSRVIVLRKTKLGESDLILTLLANDGSQLRAVARGARKPQSLFASRLELFSVADVLCSRGRSLDIVKEARLVAGNEALRQSMERSAAAAPIAELVERMTAAGLENERLFALSEAALASLAASDDGTAPAVCAAHLLKAFAFCGLRPMLDACVCCGGKVDALPDGSVALSAREGGVVCAGCRSRAEAAYVSADAVSWARFFLRSTFAEIASAKVPLANSFAVLDLCQRWSREHVGNPLKSLNFLFTCGLYG